jgi:hypothetical protein
VSNLEFVQVLGEARNAHIGGFGDRSSQPAEIGIHLCRD